MSVESSGAVGSTGRDYPFVGGIEPRDKGVLGPSAGPGPSVYLAQGPAPAAPVQDPRAAFAAWLRADVQRKVDQLGYRAIECDGGLDEARKYCKVDPQWAVLQSDAKVYGDVFGEPTSGPKSRKVYTVYTASRMSGQGVTVERAVDVVYNQFGSYQDFVPTVERSIVLSESADGNSKIVMTYSPGPTDLGDLPGQWMVYRFTKTKTVDSKTGKVTKVTIKWESKDEQGQGYAAKAEALINGRIANLTAQGKNTDALKKMLPEIRRSDYVVTTGQWVIEGDGDGVKVVYSATSDFNPKGTGDDPTPADGKDDRKQRPCVLMSRGVLAAVVKATRAAFQLRVAGPDYTKDFDERSLGVYTRGRTAGCF